jgi:hypothetical protein
MAAFCWIAAGRIACKTTHRREVDTSLGSEKCNNLKGYISEYHAQIVNFHPQRGFVTWEERSRTQGFGAFSGSKHLLHLYPVHLINSSDRERWIVEAGVNSLGLAIEINLEGLTKLECKQ